MTEEEQDIELIEKYHKGLLKEASLESFLAREKSDKDFAEKVKIYKHIIEGIQYFGKQKELADSIHEWESEIKGQSKKKQFGQVQTSLGEAEGRTIFFGRKRVYWLAAAAVSLLIASSVILLLPTEPDTMALYNQYYQPYPNLFSPIVRGDDAEGDTISINRKAFQAYNLHDYNTAAGYFREALTHDDELGREYASLYLGNCLLQLDSTTAAIDALLNIEEKSAVSDQGKWYLALAYLKSEQAEDARKVLGELTTHQNSYRDKADKILRELNK